MNSYTKQTILLVFFTCTCSGTDSWNGTLPNGYLLGLKVNQIDQPRFNRYYNHVSLFKIEFDGTVTEFWNYSLNSSDTLISDNLFAIDIENELVYLGSEDLFLALDMTTGTTKIKIHLEVPNLQFFLSYDYFAKEKAIYGVCTGNSMFDWCRMKRTGINSAKLEFLYHLPYTEELGPIDDLYFIDQNEQTLWYYPYDAAVGINYTNGDVVFDGSAESLDVPDDCIVYDHITKRVFTHIWNGNSFYSVGLGEIFPKPKQRKILLDMSAQYGDLAVARIGTCAYDQTTHTMIALMRNFTTFNLLPTHLLLIDTISLTYKLIPLPTFQEKGWDNISALRFISHKL